MSQSDAATDDSWDRGHESGPDEMGVRAGYFAAEGFPIFDETHGDTHCAPVDSIKWAMGGRGRRVGASCFWVTVSRHSWCERSRKKVPQTNHLLDSFLEALEKKRRCALSYGCTCASDAVVALSSFIETSKED